MRRIYSTAAAGVLLACLATWAALGAAQPNDETGRPDVPSAQAGDPPPLPAVPLPPPPPLEEKALVPPPPPSEAPRQMPPALPVPPTPGVEKDVPLVAPPPPAVEPPVPAVMPRGEKLPAAPPRMPDAATAEIHTPHSTSAKAAFDEKMEVTPVTPDNPSGRQEPSVSLEWVGTQVAKVGQSADYSIVVRNTCGIPVQQVTVRVRVPAGLTVQGGDPRPAQEGGMLVWELGTLMAKQEKTVSVKMQAETKGDVTPQAWVTFTGSSVMRLRVREPKLAIKAGVPDKILVGDPAAFTLTVSNPGDGSADQVKIRALLTEGLEHARGNKIDFDIGNLAPGESRNVTLLCATRSGGAQKCEVMAEADGGLKAQDTASVNVIMPSLNLSLEGPGLRYLDRKALYVLKVTNPGDAPATNVTVADTVPAGFKVLAASDGGRHDSQARVVSWFLGEIAPGQTREVKLEVQAVNAGEYKHKATAVGARGLRAEAEKVTRVEGLAALMVEMVDTEGGPIEAGGNVSYEVRITNTGSKTETDIKLAASVPDKMQFVNAQGPVRYREEGKTVVFEPIQALAPRADAIFRINVKALEVGTVRFKTQVTSTNLTEPVVKMEAKRIYSDAPEPAAGVPTPPPAVPGAPPAMPARQ